MDYDWTVDQSEWAADLMFRSADDLARLYPRLVRHGMLGLDCFRHRDLVACLYPDTPLGDRRRRSTQITRKLKLLRMHGLIQNVPKTHRDRLTLDGQTTITTLLAARQASTKQLSQAA